jgi:two-component system phosphate regulon sensor histidine kinase PhoR
VPPPPHEQLPYRDLLHGLAALRTDPETAGGGPVALSRLLDLAQYVLGTVGMADQRAARVVAAVGTVTWALGRPVQPDVVARVCRRNEATYRIELTDIDKDAADLLAALSSQWVLVHRVDVGSQPTALVGAFFGEPASAPPTEDQRDAMTMIGAEAAHFCSAAPGSAFHPDGDDSHGDRDLFIAVTSHELRTPVTVIKGYADTLRDHWDQLDDGNRRQAAQVIGQRSDELARLVDRLLAASTMAGTARGALAPFDLLGALRQSAAELPAELRRRLRLDLPARLPPALGDRSGIPNVLTELVTNAHKYSPGPDPVTVLADADRRTVLFQVADRGMGIPPDQTQHAFDRFWQGDSGDRRRWGGAGLGLYLVRKTIERQNGWVFLRPRDGGGTVAEVRLPRGDLGRDATASGEA